MAIVWKWWLNWNANDSSWNWLNWTNNWVTWVWWKCNNAWNFTAYTTYIKDIPNSKLKVTTYSCWFLIYNNWSTSTDWRVFSNLSIWSTNYWIDIAVVRATYKIWVIHSFNWNSQWSISTNTWITTWKWVYVEVTYNWSNNNIKIYFDWVLQPTSSSTLWNPYTWYSNLYRIWQCVTWNSDTYLNWKLDDVIFQNTEKIQSEIKNKYLYYNWFF